MEVKNVSTTAAAAAVGESPSIVSRAPPHQGWTPPSKAESTQQRRAVGGLTPLNRENYPQETREAQGAATRGAAPPEASSAAFCPEICQQQGAFRETNCCAREPEKETEEGCFALRCAVFVLPQSGDPRGQRPECTPCQGRRRTRCTTWDCCNGSFSTNRCSRKNCCDTRNCWSSNNNCNNNNSSYSNTNYACSRRDSRPSKTSCGNNKNSTNSSKACSCNSKADPDQLDALTPSPGDFRL